LSQLRRYQEERTNHNFGRNREHSSEGKMVLEVARPGNADRKKGNKLQMVVGVEDAGIFHLRDR
jgi:hypothetical protein